MWYERGAGFAEGGLWRARSVASVTLSVKCALPVIVLLVCSAVAFLPVLNGLRPRWFPGAVLLSALPTYLLMNRVCLKRDREMKFFVARRNGIVCPRCLYDLRGAGAISKCPECGQSVDLEKLPKQWARTVPGLWNPAGDHEAVRGWMDV